MNSAGRVKLSDFGILAMLGSSQSLARSYVGTAVYMSPERIQSAPYSYPADVWGLGLSLLTAGLGRFPFAHSPGSGGFWALAQTVTSERMPGLPGWVAPACLCVGATAAVKPSLMILC